MQIAVLNESFLENSHFDQLKELGTLKVFADTATVKQAIDRAKDCDIVIADMFCWKIDSEFFKALPKLRLLCVNSTAFDRVDLQAARQNKTLVCNVPGFSTEAVAEFVFALAFALARNLPSSTRDCTQKAFHTDPTIPEHTKYLGFDLKGKTLGILGLGSIGQRVAEIGNAFGMQIIGWSRTLKRIPDVKLLTKEEVFRNSDVLSVNLSLNKDCEKIVNAQTLALMKKTAVLINTARDGHLNHAALYDSLVSGQIAGAASDIPTDFLPDKNLTKLPNFILTPHQAWYTQESLVKMADIIVDNVKAFIEGKPQNVVLDYPAKPCSE